MTTKHTPGPWTVHSCEIHPHHEITAECGRRIATQNDYHDGQDKANARLIAASPKLFAALVRLETAARHRNNTMGDPSRLIEVTAELNAAAEEARAVIAEATKGGE